MGKFIAGPVETGNIAARRRIGNACVLLCDDACRNKEDGECREILRRISRITCDGRRDARANR